jgi:hypothetical protein
VSPAFAWRQPLKDIVERVIAPLVGLRVWCPRRETDLLKLHFGEARRVADEEIGEFTLQVACAWRIAGPTAILVASGDLFTPADENAELETFDWDVAGASWWDRRIADLASTFTTEVVLTTFLADSYGGVRLVCTSGIEIELFPNSSAAPHVETEFWRLLRPDEPDQYVAVGTSGVELVQPA